MAPVSWYGVNFLLLHSIALSAFFFLEPPKNPAAHISDVYEGLN